jgi:hypothetical protein
MTGEAILRDDLGENPIDFTVADGATIPKGTLLKLTDPRTAIASSGAGDMIAGIAAIEKLASDGQTRISVWRKGVFDMLADGTIAIGGAVMADGTDNQVIASTGVTGAAQIGYALEAAVDGEVFQVLVNVGGSGAIA